MKSLPEAIPFLIVFPIFIYWVIYRLSSIVFQKLTARWFAIGITSSLFIGNLLFFTFTHFQLIELNDYFFENFLKYLIISSLLSLIPHNLIVLPLIYWRDKSIASKQRDELIRIPENALHALSFFGGYLGAWIGQTLFKHKTSKATFQKKHYLITFISVLIFSWLIYSYFNLPSK